MLRVVLWILMEVWFLESGIFQVYSGRLWICTKLQTPQGQEMNQTCMCALA